MKQLTLKVISVIALFYIPYNVTSQFLISYDFVTSPPNFSCPYNFNEYKKITITANGGETWERNKSNIAVIKSFIYAISTLPATLTIEESIIPNILDPNCDETIIYSPSDSWTIEKTNYASYGSALTCTSCEIRIFEYYKIKNSDKNIVCGNDKIKIEVDDPKIYGNVNLMVKKKNDSSLFFITKAITSTSKIIELGLEDLPLCDWLDKEIEFTVVRPEAIESNQVITWPEDVSSKHTIGGYFFLSPPTLADFNYDPPLCNETTDAKMTLTFPQLPNVDELEYLITIKKYIVSTIDIYSGTASYLRYTEDGKYYVYKDGFSEGKEISMGIGGTQFTIDELWLQTLDKDVVGDLTITAGMYCFEVRKLGKTATSLCTEKIYREIIPPAPLAISLDPVEILSTNYHTLTPTSTGSVILTASGGKSGCTYRYKIGTAGTFVNMASSTVTINSLSNGDTIFLTNSDDCAVVSSIVSFTQPSVLTIANNTSTTILPTCNAVDGANSATSYTNGQLGFTTTGGLGDNSYSIAKKNIDNTYTAIVPKPTPINGVYSGLSNGNYQITVTDLGSNSHSIEHDLTQAQILGTIETPQTLNCYTDKYTLNVTGTTSETLSYKLSTESSYTEFSNADNIPVPAGTHSVKISNTNCYKVLSLVVDGPTTALSVSATPESNDICGKSTGSVKISISGGWENDYPYRIEIRNAANLLKGSLDITSPNALTDNLFEGLASGTYTITAYSGYTSSNKYKCSANNTFTIVAKNPLDVISYSTNFESCVDKSDGSITLGQTNVITSPYTIKRSINGGADESVTLAALTVGLTATNSYEFTISETSGRMCSHVMTLPVNTIKVNPLALKFNSTSYNSINSTCSGAKNGTLTINAASAYGIDNYTITNQIAPILSPSNTSGVFNNQRDDTYNVLVTDAKGCTITTDAIIEPDEEPISWASLEITPPFCEQSGNGSVKIINPVHKNSLPLTYSLKLSNNAVGTPDGNGKFSNLSNATGYIIIASDDNNCSNSVSFDLATKNYHPTITRTNIDSLACSTASNASIEFVASNPSSTGNEYNPTAYTFNYTGFAESQGVNRKTYSGLNSTARTLTVTDDIYHCSNSLSVTPSVMANPVSLSPPNITPASCITGTNGKVEVAASGGKPNNGNYAFNFGGKPLSGTTASFGGYTPGNYGAISVTDAAGCTASSSPITISNLTNGVTISNVVKTNPACNNAATGKIGISLINKNVSPSFTYSFNSGATSFPIPSDSTISNLNFGNYNLTITDAFGCSATFPGIALANPKVITLSDSIYNYIQEKGANTGNYNIDVSNVSNNYNYKLTNLSNNTVFQPTTTSNTTALSINNFPASTYRFELWDEAMCNYFDGKSVFTHDFVMREPEKALVISTSSTNPLCNLSADGQITIATDGGWGNAYEYSLNNTDWVSTNIFGELKDGIYSAYVRDTSKWFVTSSLITLTQPPVFSLTNLTTKNATCPVYSNGLLNVTAINGIYSPTGFKYSVTPVNPAGAVFEQSILSSDFAYNHLAAGSYSLKATDDHACVTNTLTFTIGEPQKAELAYTNNLIRKKGDATGYINVTMSGGNGIFDYRLTPSKTAVPSLTETHGTTLNYTSLVADSYLLEVQDTAHCIYEGTSPWITRTIAIEEPEFPLSLEITTKDVSCNGFGDGKISFAAEGGWGNYSYKFNTASVTNTERTGLSANIYTISVTDNEGITTDSTKIIIQPETLVATLNHLKHLNCYNEPIGEIHLDVTGGTLPYTINSNKTEPTEGVALTGLLADTYTTSILDAHNCATLPVNYTLTQPSKISLNSYTQVKPGCSSTDGELHPIVSGGTGAYQYQWNHYNTLLKIYQPLANHNSLDALGLMGGNYRLDVTDANSCVVPLVLGLDNITDLTIASITTTPVSCFGYADGSATALVQKGNPPYSYNWTLKEGGQSLNETANLLLAGGSDEYSLGVSDSKGCFTSLGFTINTPAQLGYTTNSLIQPLCLGGLGGTIDVLATGGTAGYNYLWSNTKTTSAIANLVPGDYSLQVTDNHACMANFPFKLAYQRQVKPVLGIDTLICNYNTLPINGGNYASFNWSSTNGFTSAVRNVSLKDPGTYYLQVRDADNCWGYDTMKLDVSYLKITSLVLNDVTCNSFANGSAAITVEPAAWQHSIAWSDKSNKASLNNLSGGTYSVTVKDPYQCFDMRSFAIFEPTALSITSISKDPLCAGIPDGEIEITPLGGVGNYTNSWNTGGASTKLTKLTAGTYNLSLKDKNNCELLRSFDLTNVRTLQPQLGADATLCSGNSLLLYPGAFNKYKWWQNTTQVGTDSAYVAADAGLVKVQVNDASNCVASDSVTIAMRTNSFTPEFLMAGSVAAGDTLLLVEVSQPKPTNLDWQFTGNPRVVEQGAYYCLVIFDEPTMAQVTLSAYNNGCMGQVWKNVLVTEHVEEGAKPQGNTGTLSQIVSLMVSPNPTTGFFTADVKLNEIAPTTLYLVNIASGQMIEQKRFTGVNVISQNFTLSNSGPYALFVESKGERAVVKIIVK